METTRLIGLLGGCSDVATGHMYARINALGNARLGGWHIPETLISGMDFGVIEAGVRGGDWAMLKAYLALHLDHLAPADVVVCGSNTLHKVLPELMEGREQSFIHIQDPTAEAAKAAGVGKLVLLGTKSTMGGGYAAEHYRAAHGLEIVVPTEAEQVEVDRIIFSELCRGEVRAESREAYVAVCRRLAEETGATGVILGCTEIETLLRPEDLPEIELFDTMELLCRAAVEAVVD